MPTAARFSCRTRQILCRANVRGTGTRKIWHDHVLVIVAEGRANGPDDGFRTAEPVGRSLNVLRGLHAASDVLEVGFDRSGCRGRKMTELTSFMIALFRDSSRRILVAFRGQKPSQKDCQQKLCQVIGAVLQKVRQGKALFGLGDMQIAIVRQSRVRRQTAPLVPS